MLTVTNALLHQSSSSLAMKDSRKRGGLILCSVEMRCFTFLACFIGMVVYMERGYWYQVHVSSCTPGCSLLLLWDIVFDEDQHEITSPQFLSNLCTSCFPDFLTLIFWSCLMSMTRAAKVYHIVHMSFTLRYFSSMHCG